MAGQPCDEDDGFEPLFDYSRQQAPPVVRVDDSDDDDVSVLPVFDQQKNSQPKKVDKKIQESKPAKTATVEILDDDNWLPPPPKFTKKVVRAADPCHIQLRMKQAELLQLTAKASKDLEELDRRAKVSVQSNNSPAPAAPPPPPEGGKKEKVLIKVQDKDGSIQSFRIGKDDKFERLFNAYATAVKASLSDLVFRFDGEQIMATVTPRNLDLEDEDVIEVYLRSGGH